MTNHQWISVALTVAAAVCALVTAVILLREARDRDMEQRVLAVAGGRMPDYRAVRIGGISGFLFAIGDRLHKSTRLFSEKDLAGLESMIASAGLNPRRLLPVVLGGKVVLMMLTPLLAILYCLITEPSMTTRVVIVAISFVLGMLGPDWILAFIRRPYTRALQRGVIDALDLLIVCSEAGMGLESALEQVAREMQHSNRPTASALNSLLDEIRLLPDRRVAFANFGQRSSVDGLQRLATMMAQSLHYGTPLGQALRAVANQLRRERMIQLESQAAKLPAKLVLPLILFIMPCLIIVLVGASFLRLFDALGAL